MMIILPTYVVSNGIFMEESAKQLFGSSIL